MIPTSNATLESLRSRSGTDIRAAVPLAPFTSFKIGGPAEYFLDATDENIVMRAFTAASELDVPVTILGGGSNVLVADGGVRGLVIRMTLQGFSVDGSRVVAAAGMASGLVSLKATDAGFTGLEWMAGLPGTIGGAVRGNAGMFGGEIADVLETVRVFRDGVVATMTAAECGFAYRDSIFKRQPGSVVFAATFALAHSTDPDVAKATLRDNLLKKKAQQPVEYPTAGCVFVNWSPASSAEAESLRASLDLDRDEPIPFTPAGAIPASWIIDRAGLKGFAVGHVSVSGKHGNFLINDGQGSADEVLQLIAALKTRVRNGTHGVVQLREEVEVLGL